MIKQTPNGKIPLVVPMHQEIDTGTLLEIIRQSKMTRDDFLNCSDLIYNTLIFHKPCKLSSQVIRPTLTQTLKCLTCKPHPDSM